MTDDSQGRGHAGRHRDGGDRPDRGHRESRHLHERDGRRSGRMFDHGELRLVVLALVAEKPRHGYEIMKDIEDRVAGTYSPSPGVIYPTLTLLDERGHATVTERDGRKLYAITPAGTAYLAACKIALDGALARMRSISTAHGGGVAAPIAKASEALKLALRQRQSRGPLSEQQVLKIAAALDTAALAIEQS